MTLRILRLYINGMPLAGKQDAKHRFLAFLATKNLRMTAQRQAIIDTVFSTEEHFTADQLLSWARQRDKSVSRATVYRTLAILEKAGAVQRNEFDGAGARFELADRQHHDHLINLDTGVVVEFHSPRIEQLQAEIAAELGHEIEWHRLELYGRKTT